MRKADRIAIVAVIAKVQYHYHVIAGTARLPAMEGEQLVSVVHMMHIDMLAQQYPCGVIPVEAQANQVAIEVVNTLVGVKLVQIQRGV